HRCPDLPGPGSSSLPILMGTKFAPLRDCFAATVALISCVLLEVNKNQQKKELRSDFFLRMGLQSVTSVLGTAYGGVLRPCGGILPCIGGGSFSRHSPVSNSPVPRRLDRWPRRALPVPQRCRWVFRRVQSEGPWPRLSKRADGASCGTFHSGTSRSSPGPRKSLPDFRIR